MKDRVIHRLARALRRSYWPPTKAALKHWLDMNGIRGDTAPPSRGRSAIPDWMRSARWRSSAHPCGRAMELCCSLHHPTTAIVRGAWSQSPAPEMTTSAPWRMTLPCQCGMNLERKDSGCHFRGMPASRSPSIYEYSAEGLLYVMRFCNAILQRNIGRNLTRPVGRQSRPFALIPPGYQRRNDHGPGALRRVGQMEWHPSASWFRKVGFIVTDRRALPRRWWRSIITDLATRWSARIQGISPELPQLDPCGYGHSRAINGRSARAFTHSGPQIWAALHAEDTLCRRRWRTSMWDRCALLIWWIGARMSRWAALLRFLSAGGADGPLPENR